MTVDLVRCDKRSRGKATKAGNHAIPEWSRLVLLFGALMDGCQPRIAIALVGEEFGKEQPSAMVREAVVLSLAAVAVHGGLSEAAHFPSGDS